MQNLVIYGAGGLGRELLGLLRAIDPDHERWRFLGFIDDAPTAEDSPRDEAVVGDKAWLTSVDEPTAVVLGIASPSVKATLYAELTKNPHIFFPVLVHPLAYVEPSASLAPGTVVSPFCFVAVNAQLGICTFLNAASQVGHDSCLGDFSSVMPSVNISGNVSIGTKTLIGVGSKILQGLTVGSNSTVGIGSVVLSNVPDHSTVMGYPARLIKLEKKDSEPQS